jgi:hypothetical protein
MRRANRAQRQSYKRRSTAVVNDKIKFFCSALFIAGQFSKRVSHGNLLSMLFYDLLLEKEPLTQTKLSAIIREPLRLVFSLLNIRA